MSTPGALRTVRAVTANELRRLVRDRVAMFFVVALPVVVIVVIGLTIGTADRVVVGVVVEDAADPFAAELVTALRDADGLVVRTYGSLGSVQSAVRHHEVASGVVVPAGYGTDLLAGRTPTITLVDGPSAELVFVAGTAVTNTATAQAAEVQSARFATEQAGGTVEENLAEARRLGAQTVQVAVDTVGSGRTPGAFDYTAPANLVLFVFLNSLTAAGALVEDRRTGMLRRILSTPTSSSTLLGGVGGARLTFAVGQSMLVVVLGVFLGVTWGQPVAAVTLVVVWALVGAAAGLLMATSVRNASQAIAIGPPLGIALGMLGGCMWPLEIVSPAMRAIGHLTPQAWAMDAWTDLVFRSEGLAAILPELGVLLGFVVALGGLAVLRMRQWLVTPVRI